MDTRLQFFCFPLTTCGSSLWLTGAAGDSVCDAFIKPFGLKAVNTIWLYLDKYFSKQ